MSITADARCGACFHAHRKWWRNIEPDSGGLQVSAASATVAGSHVPLRTYPRIDVGLRKDGMTQLELRAKP